MNRRDHLIEWLKDAHAMEQQALEIMEKQRDNLENYPDMKVKIARHIDETRRQAERVEECIRLLDGDTSMFKDTTGKLMGNVNAVFNSMMDDEVVKNIIADYAFENFEIACYKSLIEAAHAVGEKQIVRLCKENLREEEDMASWVGRHIESITLKYIERDEIDKEAKR